MGDMGEFYNDWKEYKKERRARLGVKCPRCKEIRPKAHPSILLPAQRCKVDGYVDPRPRNFGDDDPAERMEKADG